ncbi:hypothetical protein L218DRAFT_460884 [Marasmius fiardii PR-910]|nr:hypothetical protein L218DRAFT_460884 [Marasmius fiardii PR-910]
MRTLIRCETMGQPWVHMGAYVLSDYLVIPPADTPRKDIWDPHKMSSLGKIAKINVKTLSIIYL